MHHRSLDTAVVDTQQGLYIAIPVYFGALCIIAFYSYQRLHKQVMSGNTDIVTGHFLGGRSFGPLMTAGTTFASLFSGYTVVGIPNESFASGFIGFRWMPCYAVVAVILICTGMRLRKASVVRNHQSSVDFVTDRFRSQSLRYTILFIQIMACIIYVAAQVNSLWTTVNSMFGIPLSNVWPTIGIMTAILLFEWAGGLCYECCCSRKGWG